MATDTARRVNTLAASVPMGTGVVLRSEIEAWRALKPLVEAESADDRQFWDASGYRRRFDDVGTTLQRATRIIETA